MILRENTETQLISIPSPDSRSPRTCSTLSTISSLNPATKTPRCKIQFVVNWTSTQVGGTPSLQSTSHYHYVKNPQIMGPYLHNYSESPPNFHGFVACDYQAIEDPWSPHYKSPCMKHESKTLCLTSATQNVDTKEKHEAIICNQCILYFTHGEILCNHVPIATRCMLTLDSKTKQVCLYNQLKTELKVKLSDDLCTNEATHIHAYYIITYCNQCRSILKNH